MFSLRHSRRLLVLLGACALTLPARGADSLPNSQLHTQSPDDEARALFQAGLEQGRAGEYDAALQSFERAYAIKPHTRVLSNIARAHELLGHTALAIATYESYLSLADDLSDAERGALEATVQRLRGAPPTAVGLETAVGSAAPSPVKPLGAALSPAALDASTPDSPAPVPVSKAAVTSKPPSDAASSRVTWRNVGIAGVILGGVTLAASAAVYFWNDAQYHEWQTLYREASALPNSDPNRRVVALEANGQLSQVHTADAVALGLAIGGVALTTAGIGLWIWGSKPVNVSMSPFGVHAHVAF